MSMSTLRLVVSLLVVFVLLSFAKPHWFMRVFIYLRRNTKASMAVANSIDRMEKLEYAITISVYERATWENPLPEDIQQRLARLPERMRSCIAMMKDVYNSLWYEGINEACKEFEDAMDELLAVEAAVALHPASAAPNSDAPEHLTVP